MKIKNPHNADFLSREDYWRFLAAFFFPFFAAFFAAFFLPPFFAAFFAIFFFAAIQYGKNFCLWKCDQHLPCTHNVFTYLLSYDKQLHTMINNRKVWITIVIKKIFLLQKNKNSTYSRVLKSTSSKSYAVGIHVSSDTLFESISLQINSL